MYSGMLSTLTVTPGPSLAALRTLDPDSGAYVNEADPDEPDWQHAFWGDHYPELFELKARWDPDGVFYCKPCVGAERWEVVGQRLCRVVW